MRKMKATCHNPLDPVATSLVTTTAVVCPRKRKMIRRDPTRIEFTMEDVEKYKMRVQNASNVSSKATPAGKNGLAGGINAANQVADHPMRNFLHSFFFGPLKAMKEVKTTKSRAYSWTFPFSL